MISTAKYLYDTDGDGNIVDTTNPIAIKAIIYNVPTQVPLDTANRHYQEIMALVEAGELTIEPAGA